MMQDNSTEEEYDEATCVTASELRSMGYEIDSKIPDIAWIHRSSIRYTTAPVDPVADDPSNPIDSLRVDASLRIEFTEPFKWFQLDVIRDIEGNIQGLTQD